MKKREIRAMKAIEKHMGRLGARAQDRVAVWTASRWAGIEFEPLDTIIDRATTQSRDFVERFWSAKILNGVLALMHYDIAAGGEVLAGVLGPVSARKLAAELLVGADATDPPTQDSRSRTLQLHPELGVDAGVLTGPDGIFGEVDPEDNDKLGDAELAAHVYGLIRMGLKEGVMSHLSDPEMRDGIIRGTGRGDLFAQIDSADFAGSIDEIYAVLESLAKGEAPPTRVWPEQPSLGLVFRDLCEQLVRVPDSVAVRQLWSAVRYVILQKAQDDPLKEADGSWTTRAASGERRHQDLVYTAQVDAQVNALMSNFPAQMTSIIHENTHECMLSMINGDADLVQMYQTGGKERVVDLWNRLRLALGLAFIPPSR